MDSKERQFSIEALSGEVGIPVRTIRYYISIGLLQGPSSRGLAASYGEEHLLRLQLIRRLVDQHLPLKEIAERLEGLDVDDLRAILAKEARREMAARRESVHQSPSDYIAGLLDRARQARQESAAPDPSGGPPALRSRQTLGTPVAAPEAWSRVELAPGLELHIRSDVAKLHRGLVDRVIKEAESSLRGKGV